MDKCNFIFLCHIYTIYVEQQLVGSRCCVIYDGSGTMQTCYANHTLFSHYRVFLGMPRPPSLLPYLVCEQQWNTNMACWY
jgi:hypothetical protein